MDYSSVFHHLEGIIYKCRSDRLDDFIILIRDHIIIIAHQNDLYNFLIKELQKGCYAYNQADIHVKRRLFVN